MIENNNAYIIFYHLYNNNMGNSVQIAQKAAVATSENVVRLTTGTFEKTSQLASTTANKSLELANEGIGRTLDVAIGATKALTDVGKEGVNAAGTIGLSSIKTSQGIAENGLELVSQGASTGTDITKATLSSTKRIATTGLTLIGDGTTAAMQTTANSLSVINIKLNNSIKRQKDSAMARGEADKILTDKLSYKLLRTDIMKDFKEDINIFLKNFKQMISEQVKILNSNLEVYKISKCERNYYSSYFSGKFTCNKEIEKQVLKFQKGIDMQIVKASEFEGKMRILLTTAENNIMTQSLNVSLTEYATNLERILDPLLTEANNTYTQALTLFTDYANVLNVAETEVLKEEENEKIDEILGPVVDEKEVIEEVIEGKEGGKKKNRKNKKNTKKGKKRTKKIKKRTRKNKKY
jgi:hypothetical protein